MKQNKGSLFTDETEDEKKIENDKKQVEEWLKKGNHIKVYPYASQATLEEHFRSNKSKKVKTKLKRIIETEKIDAFGPVNE